MATHEPRDSNDARSTTTEVRPQDKPPRDVARSGESARRDPLRPWSDPLVALRRLADRLDCWSFAPSWAGDSMGRRPGLAGAWAPPIDSIQRGDRFIVRVDLPGLTRDDVHVELDDDAVVISGERTREEHRDQDVYTSERHYGRFCRVVPLPDGAMQDSVRATFHNGVLEVTMQAPSREAASRRRRVEISAD